ncbi:BTAD domain-containing putative transcriptional regulator, partial [Virgisporangium ochraceum]|uniref:BTAD domain-containing putative transcriptional regulator n=1 Tax=Virgisporangium ochraceum TaxID=65505 RepID=UPI0019451C35
MQVAVLGPARVTRAGRPVPLGAPKHRALLAALALHAGRPVSADTLIGLMWGDGAPPAAGASLQTYVAHLRRALEPDRAARAEASVLVTTSLGYRLTAPVDVTRFAELVEGAHRGLDSAPPEALRADLDTALELWGGTPFADLPDGDAVTAERVRLGELRLVAVEDRARLRLAAGEHAAVAAELAVDAVEHPLRESLCALLVAAHAGAGQQGRALELLREMRARLDGELGIEPGPVLRDLELAVLRQDASVTRTARVAPAAPRPAELPLIGRVAELAALDAVLERADGGAVAAAMLVGEPGIGKTRLGQAMAARAATRGFAVAVGRCSQDDGAPPLWPWLAVLDALRIPLPAADSSFALWQDVTSALAHASTVRPLLLILDDLHWADASSLKLLRHVVATGSGRIALLGTRRARPEPTGALAEILETLARYGGTRLDLAGLDMGEVRELVRAAGGRAGDAASLHDRTGGNAFLLTELARLDRPDEVPAAVADVVTARSATLPEPTRELLRAAAVVGREFELGVLAAVAGGTEDDALDRLEPALAEGLVVETGPERFRFSHALVRDAVHDGIPPTRRARRHAATARVLAGAGDLPRAARHWLPP